MCQFTQHLLAEYNAPYSRKSNSSPFQNSCDYKSAGLPPAGGDAVPPIPKGIQHLMAGDALSTTALSTGACDGPLARKRRDLSPKNRLTSQRRARAKIWSLLYPD